MVLLWTILGVRKSSCKVPAQCHDVLATLAITSRKCTVYLKLGVIGTKTDSSQLVSLCRDAMPQISCSLGDHFPFSQDLPLQLSTQPLLHIAHVLCVLHHFLVLPPQSTVPEPQKSIREMPVPPQNVYTNQETLLAAVPLPLPSLPRRTSGQASQ